MERKVYEQSELNNLICYANLKARITSFKNIMFKPCKDYKRVREYGTQHLINTLLKDYDRSIVVELTDGDLEFVNSSFVSAFMKRLMIRYINEDEKLEDKEATKKILLSSKTFNDMTCDEFEQVFNGLGAKIKYNYVPLLFTRYFFTINGDGAKEFITTKLDKEYVARQLIRTSGMTDRSEYYAGLGVRYCDLSDKNLTSIYKKLLKLNKEHAKEFFIMVNSMKTLGATEFIDSFIRFGENGFKTKDLTTSSNNIIADKATHQGIAVGFIVAMANPTTEDVEVYKSQQMKRAFFYTIMGSLAEIYPEYFKEKDKKENKNYDYWQELDNMILLSEDYSRKRSNTSSR